MADARPPANAERPPQSDSRQKALKILSPCLKAALILFPIPTALLTEAPLEIVLAAVYATLFTAAGLLALWEIADNVNHLRDAMATQNRPS